jgi:hypothetical protein
LPNKRFVALESNSTRNQNDNVFPLSFERSNFFAPLRIINLFLLLSIPTHSSSQNISSQDIQLYNKQRTIGATLNTHGYGMGCYLSRFRGAYKLQQLTIDFNYVKHEKETKTWYPLQDPNARPYFYGKLNSFFILRTGVGSKNILTEKLRKSGVQVSWQWSAGPVLGILKPVYLEIIYESASLSQGYLQVERFNPDVHYIDNIYGRASSLKGLNQLSVSPGGFAKLSFSFEYSNEKERLKGIEVGACADIFGKKIPIMAIPENENNNPENHQLFLSLFVNFFMGTKYDQK